MACVSETQYQFCVNNLPSGTINSCPTGYVCSTATSVTCQLSTSGFAATCGSCNVCNANLTFACTGSNTYALCLGTTVPSATAVGSCGTGLVCNVNLPQMCGNSATGVSIYFLVGTIFNSNIVPGCCHLFNRYTYKSYPTLFDYTVTFANLCPISVSND